MMIQLSIISYIQSISINDNNICPTFIYLCSNSSNNNKSVNKNFKKQNNNDCYIIDSDNDIPDRPLTEQEIEERLSTSIDVDIDIDTSKKNDIYFKNPMYVKLLKSDIVKRHILQTIKKRILQARKSVKEVISEYMSKIIILHDPNNILPIIVPTQNGNQMIFTVQTQSMDEENEDLFIMDNIISIQKHRLLSISKINTDHIKSIPYMISSTQFHSLSSVRDLHIITNPRIWESTARKIAWMDYRDLSPSSLLTHRQLCQLRTPIVKQLFDVNPMFLVFPLYSIYQNIYHKDLVQIISRLTLGGTMNIVDHYRYSSWSTSLGMYIYKIKEFNLLDRQTIETGQNLMNLYNSGYDLRPSLYDLRCSKLTRIMGPVTQICNILKTFLDIPTYYTFDHDPSISYIDLSCHLIVGRSTIVMDHRIPKKRTFEYLDNPIASQSTIRYRLIVTNLTDDISLINILHFIFKKIGTISIECLHIKDTSNLIRKLSYTRGFCYKMFFERCFPRFIDYGIQGTLPQKIYVGDMVYIPDLGIVSKIIDVYRRLYDDPNILNSIRLEISPVLIPKIEHRYVTNGHRCEYIQIENGRDDYDHSLCCGLLNKKTLISVFNHMVLKI